MHIFPSEKVDIEEILDKAIVSNFNIGVGIYKIC